MTASAIPGPGQPAAPRPDPASSAGLDALLDVSLQVSVEIGRARLTLEELLRLGPGSVVELDRAVGDPVDIHVGDRLFAHGEVVVLDDRFAVRITQLAPRAGEAAA